MSDGKMSPEELARERERLTSMMAGDRAHARFKVAAHIAALEKERDEARAEVERVQRLPEQEWAEASAAITSALALHAREDQPAAQRALAALDRAKVYVGRRLAERDEWKARAESVLKQAETFEVDCDAALADNAALVEKLGVAREAMAEVDDSDAPAALCRAEDSINVLLKCPHPGAALLEEHRKALGEAQKALESQQAECHTLRRAFLHERHRADSAGAPPEHAFNAKWAENLLAEERKALVRARNEGLQEAELLFVTLEQDSEDEGDTDAALDARHWASRIRDMMEPEK